jgi:diacylglycerol kinase family enzyme
VSRIGLIINTQSGPEGAGATAARLARAAEAHCIPVARTRCPGEIDDALRAFARAGVTVLAVHGGDGTVDAVLTRLRTRGTFATEPVLALIPGGTTNMTHADVGLRHAPVRALDHIAAACLDGVPEARVRRRRPVRVARSDAAEPFYGFFVAGAAIPRVIRRVRERLHSRGLTGRAGSAIALAWSIMRLLRGNVARDPVLHPDAVGYAVDDGPWHETQAVVFLATTLERLILGLRPAPPRGRLGVGALTFPYARLAWRLPGFLRGRGAGELGADIGRAAVETLHLRLASAYTVDGELFDPPADGAVTLTAAPPARFLVL